MSSLPSVTAHAEEFRRRSRLVAGMFHAVPKHELTDVFSLQMHLQTMAMSLPAGHRVQEFVDALREKVKTVGEEFAERISALTLSDYAYIQSLSLQADGQPLGDYLMWLFGAYFGQLLFGRELRLQREELDGMRFTPLPSQTLPSRQLAEMYHYALFDVDVGPVTAHPRARAASNGTVTGDVASPHGAEAERQAADAGDPMLSLGDIFVPISSAPADTEGDCTEADACPGVSDDAVGAIDDGAESRHPDLMMIINAQCDLSFTPEGSRTIERSRSILLLPGRLHPIWEPIPDRDRDSPRTELFERQGQGYRILWNNKEARSVPYGEFRQWHDGAGSSIARHERTARLRLPFALEVQRAFAADLTRVGMPVAPPICQAVDVRVLRAREKRFDSSEELDGAESAFLVLSRHGHKIMQQCVLTWPLVQRLRLMLETRLVELEGDLGSGGAGHVSLQQLTNQIDSLRRAIANHVEWSKLLLPNEAPAENGTREFVGGYVQIVRNKTEGDECRTSKAIAAVSLHGRPQE